jgi:hypothetical protein
VLPTEFGAESNTNPLFLSDEKLHIMINQATWNYFDRKVCLTITNRKSGKPSRWPDAQAEFERVNMKGVKKFEAIEAIGPHQSFTLSQKKILKDFIKSDNKHMLVMEDDIQFLSLEPFYDAFPDISGGVKWDILYLGGNIRGQVNKERRNLCRVTEVWTTHAVAYSRYAASVLLENFPNENEVMYDTYLGAMLRNFKAYMINPMIAVQRPDFSEIWGHEVDYTDIFKASNQKMK